jgi:hypothetical protein
LLDEFLQSPALALGISRIAQAKQARGLFP